MNKFQKFMYNKVTKHDSKSRQPDYSQPKSVKEMSPDDRRDHKKKIWKKVIIWGVVLLGLGGIIAAIVVSCTRQTEIALSPKTQLVSLKSNKFVLKDDNREYTVDLSNKNNLLTTYYSATSSQISLRLQPENSGLPITINVRLGQTSDQSYQFPSFILYQKVLPNQINYEIKGNGQDVSQLLDNQTVNLLGDFVSTAFLYATTATPGFNWLALISSFLPFILLILLFVFYYWMMKKQMGNGQESIFGIGKSNAKPVKTNVKFRDVAGIDEVETELREIVDYITRPGKYAAMGARAPKGVILYGPPGTGKTLIAKAVAGEANCPFYAISGSSFDDMLVGVGAKRVRDLFQKARKSAPAIIFIDEIDSVASKRGKNDIVGGGSGLADQTINQLLTEMDGFEPDSGVVVIGATNRADVLDEAILRPGRFDRQIQVVLPDIKGREAILKIHARNKNLSSAVNLKDVARRTPGFSGAQLENVLNEAAILAVRDHKTTINIRHIDEAIDRVIGGPARKGRVITEAEKKQIAYHEAGHALVGLHSEGTEVVQKITIIPRGDAAGYTLQTPDDQEKQIQTKSDILNQVRMTLGGRAAEEIVFGKDKISTGAANDLYKVTNIVRAMVMQLGMTEVGLTQFVPSEGTQNPYQQKLYSEATSVEIDRQIETMIQTEYANAKKIIKANKKELDLIVETLMLLETIIKEQIDYIHKHLELPPEAQEAKAKQQH